MKTPSFTDRRLYKLVALLLCCTFLGAPLPRATKTAAAAQPQRQSATGLDPALLGALNNDALPQELRDLAATSLLGPNGEPDGILIDAGAQEMAANDTPHAPDALTQPLSVSRVQSAYQSTDTVSSTLVVTLTVTNNQLPMSSPQLPDNPTITDTLAVAPGMDPADDPNTIRNVLLVDTLTSAATLVSSTPAADRRGRVQAWSLGDIPPASNVTVALTLQVPTNITASIDLDTGASAWGMLNNRSVTAQTQPAILMPGSLNGEPVGNWLKWTPDADIYEQDMLAKAAELGQDPSRMFAFVRGLGYESYTGSLRGTRGTLWSEAGNSLDLSSLLIAMLRASGVPARYRHGTLNKDLSQGLILSMFPEPKALIGHVPAGTPVSNVAEDPRLLSETQDHWWVEAYLPGQGWRDLDPSFNAASIGQRLVADDRRATDGTDRIAEVPDALRHKVTLKVKIEEQHPLNGGSNGLSQSYPLSHTFNTVSVVGKPISLSHTVNGSGGAGMIFYATQTTYVPYFLVGDQVIQGQAFQDLISNFPLGTSRVTGEWLVIETRDASGAVEVHEREIKDLIGAAARQSGGNVSLASSTDKPLVAPNDIVQIQVVAQNRTPMAQLARQQVELTKLMPRAAEAYTKLQTLDQNDDVAISQYVAQYLEPVQRAQAALLGTMATTFNMLSGEAHAKHTKSLLTKAYVARPEILLQSQTTISDSMELSFELVDLKERVLARPGQAESAVVSTQMLLSMSDKLTEHLLLEKMWGRSPTSVVSVFQSADAANIPIIGISKKNLKTLEQTNFSPQAKARITAAAMADKLVFVPDQMVTVNGKSTIGWWEVAPDGHTLGVLENGQRAGSPIISYFSTLRMAYSAKKGLGMLGGAIFVFISFIKNFFVIATDWWVLGTAGLILGFFVKHELMLQLWLVLAHFMTVAEALLECAVAIGLGNEDFCIGAAGAIMFLAFTVLAAVTALQIASDPPLPEFLAQTEPWSSDTWSITTTQVLAQATRTARNLSLDLTTSSASLDGLTGSAWQPTARHAFVFDSLATSNAQLYAADGTLLNTGDVSVKAQDGSPYTAEVEGAAFEVSLSGSGDVATYAPALTGLGAAGSWQSYDARLTGTQPYTLTLDDAVVQLNSTTIYTGSFTLVTPNATTVRGAGHTAQPVFAPAAGLALSDGSLMLGPAAGTLSVGGAALDAGAGVAIANYSGPVSVTHVDTTSDRIVLTGEASVFSLRTSPSTSTTNPTTPVTFRAEIDANFTDTYTTTVEAPAGWDVTLDGSGLVTATPRPGTEPGEYTVLVTARSTTYPDLVVSAVHTVTTQPFQGMDLQVAPNPLITVPYGAAEPQVLANTNNGQAQIPGAAYTVTITNTSTTAHTFSVDVSGLPDGWLILSGAEGSSQAEISLLPGEVGRVGLYIKPTTATLPAAGSDYPFTVSASATDTSGLAQSVSETFTFPALAFSHLKAVPEIAYSSPGMTTTVGLTMRNVGNAAGTFAVSADLPLASWTMSGDTSFDLAAGQAVTESLTLATPEGEPGQDYPIRLLSESGMYTQTARLVVRMVSQQALAAHEAAEVANRLPDPELSAALTNAGIAIQTLENNLLDQAARDRLVTAIEQIVEQLEPYSALPATGALQAVAQALRNHTSETDIAADLVDLREALHDLQEQLAIIAQYGLAAQITPGAAITLPGRPVTYTLEIANRGKQSTTYVATITPALPSFNSPVTRTLAPGQVVTVPLAITPDSVGLTTLTASVKAVDAGGADIPYVAARATAGLRVVDSLAAITQVAATPNFVETGTSATQISFHVANIANWRMGGQAAVEVLAPSGTHVFSTTLPITVSLNDAQNTFALSRLNTSGFATGVYTVNVDLDITSPQALTGLEEISGYTLFSVGQGIKATANVSPAIVAPGTSVVTTTLSTERTFFGDGSNGGGGGNPTPIMTETLQLVAPANVSGSNPAIGVPLHLEAGTYDVVITDGAIRPSASGPWFDTVRINATLGPNNVREYFLGYGIDAHTGGSATHYEATALNRGKSVRIYLPQAADLRFWHSDSTPADSTGSITLQVRKIYEASNSLNRRVEGALGWAIPRQQSDTMRFDTSDPNNRWAMTNQCAACHVQSQALIGLSDAAHKLPNSPSDIQTMEALAAFIQGSVNAQGRILNTHNDYGNIQTGLAAWALSEATDRPAVTPAPDLRPDGIKRYEDNHELLRYNGKPFVGAVGWKRSESTLTSAGSYAQHNAANQTISLAFTGSWVRLGFLAGPDTGLAQVAIDGVSYGTIDTYSRVAQPISRSIQLDSNAPHTIQITVTGQRNAFSAATWVRFDYLDVWDGTAMPEGRFEDGDSRVRSSADWTRTALSGASGGQYWTGGSSVWFPFTGTSVAYQAIASTSGRKVEVLIDGSSRGLYDLYSATTTTRTFAFGELSAGPHILELR
ncbi:MAG TPA: transglutaminase domain-containing protein, partial [Herpetosiphonaceae bacterium]